MSAGTLRLLLFVFLFAMYLLALLYLRNRRLTWLQFTAWALFALLVPIMGPLFTILARPGEGRPRQELSAPPQKEMKP